MPKKISMSLDELAQAYLELINALQAGKFKIVHYEKNIYRVRAA